jgi:hypothetical protein
MLVAVAVACALFPAALTRQAPAPGAFKAELVGVDVTPRRVRPGAPFTVTLRYRNAGTAPAPRDYHAFLHIEGPERLCAKMAVHGDHPLDEPTSLWQPGVEVVDGPVLLRAPAAHPDHAYQVHVGLYDLGGTGERMLDQYADATLEVSDDARETADVGPRSLSAGALAARRAAVASRIPAARRLSLQAPAWRFDVERTTGAWQLVDRAGGALWTSNLGADRFGRVTLTDGSRSVVRPIGRIEAVEKRGGALVLTARPTIDGAPCGVTLTLTARPRSAAPGGPQALSLAFASRSTSSWRVADVRLLDDALAVTDADTGRLYVPDRLGIELDPATELPSSRTWRTYDGITMAMAGAVKRGCALLVNWKSVDATLGSRGSWSDRRAPGARCRTLSLAVAGPAGECELQPLGRGGYVEIARAYRRWARAKGWLRTWAEKQRAFPGTGQILGATNFKPFVFSRTVGSSVYSPDGKEHSFLSYTFDEIARVAEHWRKDLQIDRASVTLAGWVNGGYDVRHPDVLPAAPECGGNEGLADAARRIKACGFLFGLHDNYQDMYADAASFGQSWLNKDAAGVSRMGGNWAGGQAWQVCAVKQVELAQRKATNLPEIARLFGPTSYFIDTVFAWPLVTCEDPAHPMARQDDLEWKSKLCLLAKQHMGIFGSEEGREWAVPCADYLEGLFGQQTDAAPGQAIPLFPLVYHDCVHIQTHQGNRIGPGDDKKMTDHVLFAQMQLPSFGPHLYWQGAQPAGVRMAPLAPRVEPAGGRSFRITYRWRVSGPAPAGAVSFVHFTSPLASRAEGIAFQHDHVASPEPSQWAPGVVEDGPYTLDAPADVAGRVAICVGLLADGQRLDMAGVRQEGGRCHVGDLVVGKDGIRFEAVEMQPGGLWARGDDGWGAGLCATDRVIKNAWEVLSPLNVAAAHTPMSGHRFLTPDRRLQRATYGDITVTAAYDRPAAVGANRLPANGFLVESSTFIAFLATRYNGVDYPEPALFTARSLDGKPIAQSSRVRIYHGFGDKRIRLAGKEFAVEREAVVRVK